MNRTYLVIDLKSFYASVECVERGLDPMTAKLVVADPERTDKTICLAVSPALKAMGVKNRCRVFEIPKNIEYIMAPPRMQKYIDYAADIYGVYLKYIAPEDIYVYSIDEAFLDVTNYLSLYKKTPKEMAIFLMEQVKERVGVRATCGIGTNMYLAKIALDITAKHAPDFIGELTEESFKETLWDHRPLSDFWRIGPGIESHLHRMCIFTMRQLAACDENRLYREFGKDAELMIDHAYGREPVTIADIKAYKPKTNSITQGQVLMRDYSFADGELIIKEMTDQLCLDLVKRRKVTSSITLMVGYSRTKGPTAATNSNQLWAGYMGAMTGATVSLDYETSSDEVWVPKVAELYRQIVDPRFMIRRVFVNANNITDESCEVQMSMFSEDTEKLQRARKVQETMLQVKNKYGKNAILKGMDYKEEAMTRVRNNQIGGHKRGDNEDSVPNGRI